MSDHPDRARPRDEATEDAVAALARLDELLGELGEPAEGAADSVEVDEPATPAHPEPSAHGAPTPRPPPPTRPSGESRSFEQRQAEARRLMQEALARRQREIEARRQTFDPERRSRERARAAVTVLPRLMHHALAAEPRSAREISSVTRALQSLPRMLHAAVGAELRRDVAAAAAERERRAQAAVASLHELFCHALAAAPEPPAMTAAAGLRVLFGHALGAVPPPVPIPDPEPEPVPEAEPEPEPDPEPEPKPELDPEPEPIETDAPEPARAGDPEIPFRPELLIEERRAWPWAVAVTLAAVLVVGSLWFSGVLAGNGEDRGDGPSFSLSDGEPTTSVVGQAESPLIEVFAETEGPGVTHRLEHPTATGAPLVFLVTDDTSSAQRVEVLLPVDPTGTRGWIDRSDLSFGVTEYRVIVRSAAHRLELWDGDELVLEVPVAIGSDAPESGALLYVKELLQPPTPDTLYGAYAFGLSGAANTLDKFSEGAGVIAIHGSDDPSVVGKDVDSGSIRLTNTDIEELVGVLPLGTPVEIR